MQQSRLVLPSPLALPFLIALASLLVSAALLQGLHSQTEKHMRGEEVHRKMASREGRVSSVITLRPLSGSLCLREMGRMRAGFSPERQAQQQARSPQGSVGQKAASQSAFWCSGILVLLDSKIPLLPVQQST